ncbi:MAG: hypothetical protein AUJ52_00185 [Elusimicrobia bacterium CG1_02_63_36]|nr:MAG: hypothetical protein AUJ52_00185 [Elusimicrobia bacterium CG1_02_63_36]
MNEFKSWILAAAALAFLFLTEQVQATRMGYELGSARSQLSGRRDRVAYLRLQIESLEAPEKLAEAARRRLKMRPPAPETLVVLGSEVDRPLQARASKRPGLFIAPMASGTAGLRPPGEESFKLSRLIP